MFFFFIDWSYVSGILCAGSIHLSAVAGMLDVMTREELKSECGGVQTLLRNHSSIFQGRCALDPHSCVTGVCFLSVWSTGCM